MDADVPTERTATLQQTQFDSHRWVLHQTILIVQTIANVRNIAHMQFNASICLQTDHQLMYCVCTVNMELVPGGKSRIPCTHAADFYIALRTSISQRDTSDLTRVSTAKLPYSLALLISKGVWHVSYVNQVTSLW